MVHVGGGLYFFVAIMVGAFVFANLIVAVVVTNLVSSIVARYPVWRNGRVFVSGLGGPGFDPRLNQLVFPLAKRVCRRASGNRRASVTQRQSVGLGIERSRVRNSLVPTGFSFSQEN